jgi:hypothetical protein
MTHRSHWNKVFGKLVYAGFLLTVLVWLGGCVLFQGNQVSLLETSYDSADMLSQQSKNLLKPGTPISIGILTDADMPVAVRESMPASPNAPLPLQSAGHGDMVSVAAPAPFGRVVLEQVGGRLVDLGYDVVRNDAGKPGQAILTGQFARASGRVSVDLRLVDVSTGRILGVYDYSLPITSEVHALLQTSGRGVRDSSFYIGSF